MRIPALVAGLLLCGTAEAQTVTLKPLIDARLRYEHVDQDGLPEDADAITARVRAGLQASSGPWSALVESEATLAILPDFNDGFNGKTRYPLVADADNVELNRAQLRYAAHGVTATAGRQLLELADQRWVGSASWRQNQQTFDAARFQWGKAKGLSVDLSYAWSDRTVNGIQGTPTRPQAIGGDNVFALVNYGAKPGTLTGFAYLVDQSDPPVQGGRLSSQTWGVRFAGSAPLSKDVKLGYAASWARQSDWQDNPNRYSADYWLGEVTVTAKALTAAGGYEVLGADKGVALTSVQTPLASLFKFNGWAGKFGTTPPDGLHDAYATLGYGWKKPGIALSATWHDFASDRLSRHYGDELDLLASVKRGHMLYSARYAHYRADGFATDTDKFWLQLDWVL